MSTDRSVRQKIDDKGNEKLESTQKVDWTKLPYDIVIKLFSCLSNQDRASLASTCKTWWIRSKTPYLWESLDLRFGKCDANATKSLASRCNNLRKIRFSGNETAASIINLKAKDLREIYMDNCKGITDTALSVLVARHEALECLHTGFHVFRNITSVAIKYIALCCPKLKKLWLSGIKEVSGEAIQALAENCPNLTDIGLIDCRSVDVTALGNFKRVVFLSLAGTVGINWELAPLHWKNLSNLVSVDVSRTDIKPVHVSDLLLSCFSIQVLCALDCPSLEQNATAINLRGKKLVAFFTDILKELATLLIDVPSERANVFIDCRKSNCLKDKKLERLLDWLEWTICSSMLLAFKSRRPSRDDFWLQQGTILLLSFLQSPYDEVQERAARALQPFVGSSFKRAEAVVREGGIRFILNLARSWREALQFESMKALSSLMRNNSIVKLVFKEGGFNILLNIARTASRTVAAEAVRLLYDVSMNEKEKSAIAEAGGVRALVDVIVKWSNSDNNRFIMETSTGSLTNLAIDEKYCLEIISTGVAQELVKLLRTSVDQGVLKKAIHCLTSMAWHGDSNRNHAAVGQETVFVEALVQLLRSQPDNITEEVVNALSYLSSKEIFREAIAAVDGVRALVALASSCANIYSNLPVVTAQTLWRLSLSEGNSIAIGQEGGVTSLILMARSDVMEVHEAAAGTLWNLSYVAENATRIIDEDGVPALVNICSYSVSNVARFMSALTLANMFDSGLDEIAMIDRLESARTVAAKAIEAFIDQYCSRVLLDAASSSLPASEVLARVTESARVQGSMTAFIEQYSSRVLLADASSSLLPASEALARVTESARVQGMNTIEYRLSGSQIQRFLTMLCHPSPVIQSFGAFALLQFTIPGDKHVLHHANLLREAGAPRLFTLTVASSTAPPQAKAFARIVLKNLEHLIANHSLTGGSTSKHI